MNQFDKKFRTYSIMEMHMSASYVSSVLLKPLNIVRVTPPEPQQMITQGHPSLVTRTS